MLSFILMLTAFAAGGYVLGTVAAQHDGDFWHSLNTLNRVFLCGYALLLVLVVINGMFVVFAALVITGLVMYRIGMAVTSGGSDDDENVAEDDGAGWPRIPVTVLMRHASEPSSLDADGTDGNGKGGGA